jgi:hypothetical protein
MRSPTRRQIALVVAVAALALLMTHASPAWSLFTDADPVGDNRLATSVLARPTGLGATTTCPAGIDHVGQSSGTLASGPTLIVASPSGVAAGDVLMLAVGWDESTGINPPAGWTEVRTDLETTYGARQTMFYKVSAGAEPLTYTFTSTGPAPEEAVGAMVAYRGVDPSDPVIVHGGAAQSGALDQFIPAPSINDPGPPDYNSRLVGFFSTSTAGNITPPPGMGERIDAQLSTADGFALAIADVDFSTTGPTGDKIAEQPGVDDLGIGQLVMLRPAAGGGSDPTATLTWTPTASPFATGYNLRRWNGATLELDTTITPRTAASYVDGPLTDGTTYDYELEAVYESWTSGAATTSVTPTCP